MRRLGTTGLILLLLAGCGQATSNYCVGGVGTNGFPGVGYLQSANAACTGTLISPHVVLTAGHCAAGEPVTSLQFTTDPNPMQDQGAPYATAVNVAFHPGFNPNYANGNSEDPGVDVALILLGNTNYGAAVSSYYSFGSEQELQNQELMIDVGYGDNPNGSTGIETVKQVLFNQLIPLTTPQGNINAGLIQAVRGPTGQIGCAGDSGSPLLISLGGFVQLVGVYSTGEDSPNESDQQECISGTQAGDYVAVDDFTAFVQAMRTQWEGAAPATCGN